MSQSYNNERTLPEFPKQINRNMFLPIRGFRPDQQPVWIMGQASEYLPEFRQMCEEYTYNEMLHKPKLICEVTLMPVNRFRFDAAIIFSDILLLVEALGLKVIFSRHPILPEPLKIGDIEKIKVKDFIGRLDYIAEAITLVRHNLKGSAALLGLAGAPWTIMTYMIEGRPSVTCEKAKSWIYAHKERAIQLLDLLTGVITEYCIMQAKAGAQLIQILDTNAEYLSKDIYTEICLPRLKSIRKHVKQASKSYGLDVPMMIYSKGSGHSVANLVDAGYDVIGLEPTVIPKCVLAAILPKKTCLQGNLDPCVLYASAQEVHTMTQRMIKKFHRSKFIANLGDHILPDTPLESIQAFIDAVRNNDNYGENEDSDDSTASLSRGPNVSSQ